jgi:NAD(P)-dependent dehydrogenase (short-subunit alcohol dehydrogenase family)
MLRRTELPVESSLANAELRNFAGIGGRLGKVAEEPLEEWKKVLDVNLTGVWLCTKYELKQMLKQESVEV